MRAPRAAAAVVLALLAVSSFSAAQSQPNLDNGFKPWGSYDETSIDSVNVMNGNLQIHIPLPFSYGQRGNRINRTYQLAAYSKTWTVITQGGGGQPLSYAWSYLHPKSILDGPTPPGSPTLVTSTDLVVFRTYVMDSSPEGVTDYYDGGYYIRTPDGASHALSGNPLITDASGEPTSFDSNDVSGYHVTTSNPNTNGIPQTAVVTDRDGNLYQFSLFQGNCTRPGQNSDPGAMPYTGSINHTTYNADTVMTCNEHADAHSLMTDMDWSQALGSRRAARSRTHGRQ